jgi:hypothetical protein
LAFLAQLAADIGGSAFRKLLPWGLLVLVTLGLGAAVAVRSAQLEGARAALAAMRHQDEMAEADVQRWTTAAAQMQKIIDDQAMQLKRQAADLTAAQRIADESAAVEAAERNRLNNQLQSLKARADAHPTEIRPLGPLVIDVLGGLHRDLDRQPAAPATTD